MAEMTDFTRPPEPSHPPDDGKSKKKAVKKAIKKSFEVVLYGIFLIIFTVTVYSTRDPVYSYQLNNAMKNMFLGNELPNITVTKLFGDLGNIDDFWAYMNGVFMPQLMGDSNGLLYSVTSQLGTARIRQLRVDLAPCVGLGPFTALYQCGPSYSSSHASTKPYGDGSAPFVYHTADELHTGYTINGIVQDYSGGGYVAYVRGDAASAALVSGLQAANWVDNLTRFIEIEVNAYNANVNQLWHGLLFVEFMPTGGIVTSSYFRTFRIYNYPANAEGNSQLSLEIIVYVFVLFYVGQEIYEMYRNRWGYLGEAWNIYDLTNLVLFLVVLIMKLTISSSVNNTSFNPASTTDFYEFHNISLHTDQLYNVLATNAFLLWCKAFKYFKFSKQANIVTATVARAIKDVFSFLIIIVSVAIGYAQAGVLAFGVDIPDYGTFLKSLYTLVKGLLGDSDLDGLQQSDPIFGPIYFFIFVVMFFFILLNVFISIMNDAYEDTKDEVEEAEEEARRKGKKDQEWVTVVKAKVFGLVPDSVKEAAEKAKRNITKTKEELREELRMADANRDGNIDRTEAEKMFANRNRKSSKADRLREALGITSVEELFNKYDVNRDGLLDAEEQRQMYEELEKMREKLVEEDVKPKKMTAADEHDVLKKQIIALSLQLDAVMDLFVKQSKRRRREHKGESMASVAE